MILILVALLSGIFRFLFSVACGMGRDGGIILLHHYIGGSTLLFSTFKMRSAYQHSFKIPLLLKHLRDPHFSNYLA